MKNKTPPNKKVYKAKGGITAGTAYALLAVLIALAGGSLMIGNITSFSSTSPSAVGRQPVITVPPKSKAAQNNLQLFTFPGVTYTPTPPQTIPLQSKITSPGSGSEGGSSTTAR